ncbi:hypothetical protein KFK09_006934 [Dendrobium nobile]|uniref:Uncharacterized protein n=1 Tax=Dendrobium nobile TaxID=94219 RepID=A0A8T3BTT0_DENNO|nr:hypothetical protein KFK09_006934 [Dendrobium nobile]
MHRRLPLDDHRRDEHSEQPHIRVFLSTVGGSSFCCSRRGQLMILKSHVLSIHSKPRNSICTLSLRGGREPSVALTMMHASFLCSFLSMTGKKISTPKCSCNIVWKTLHF